jgi:RNA-splicing ligase RtcB
VVLFFEKDRDSFIINKQLKTKKMFKNINNRTSYYHELEKRDKEILKIITDVSKLDGCRKIAALSDSQMGLIEIPNSVATIFDGYIVPQLLPNVVNCGIGLVKFDIAPEELMNNSDDLIKEIHSSLRNNPVTLSRSSFVNIIEEGAYGVLPLLNHVNENCLTSQSEGGVSSLKKLINKEFDYREIISPWILKQKKNFIIPANNIIGGGNHYLEWLKLGNIFDNKSDSKVVNNKSSYCSYHLDFLFTLELNWSFVTRKREREIFERRMKNLVKKIYFHSGVEGIKSFPNIYNYYLRSRSFTPIPLDSVEGQRYLKSVQYSMNYSYAARLALIDILVSAVEKTFNRSVEWHLISDAGHDTFKAEEYNGNTCIGSWKGCVKSDELRYGIISGLHNVPGILVKRNNNSINQNNEDWLNSYDHGIGSHTWRDKNVSDDEIKTILGEVKCYRIPRQDANWNNVKIFKNQTYLTPSLQQVLKIYNDPSAPVKPVALLDPIINYK